MHCDKDNDTHSVEEDLQASNIVDSEEEDPNHETVSSESIDNRSHRTNQQQPNGISEDKSSSSSRSIGRHNNDQNKSFDGEGTMASATMSNSTSKFTLETEDLQSPTNTSSTTTTTTASSDRKATATSSAETSTIGDSSCKNCDCIEQKEEEVDVKKRHIDATMAQINTTLGDSGNKEELSVVADDTDVQKIDENRILPAISSISTTTNRSNQISEKQQSHNSSSTVETRISNGRVGAFREGRQEPSSPLPEADDILQSQEQNDAAEEVSTPMLVHATLVVEKDGDDEGEREELRERLTPAVPDHPQSSESNDAHETTADNAERGDGNPTTVAPVHHQFGSNVVVQNVFMDEEQHIEMAPTRNNNASSAGDGPGCPSHSSSSQLVVQATQIDVDKPRKFYQKRAFWGLVMIAVLVIVLATVLPLRNEQVSNVETNNKPPPPSGRPNDSEETTDDVVGDDDYLDDLGNTIEGFVQYSLPEFSRLALQDTTSPQSLALEWLWEDPDFTSDLPNFRRIQRFALATLFFAMANDEDVNNVERTNWLTPDHECEWLTNDSPITKCPDGDRWRTIELSDFKLQKAFPPEIGLLTDLVSIDVSINRRVTGSLPTEIGLLTNMDQLFMERTGLVRNALNRWSMHAISCIFPNSLKGFFVPCHVNRLAPSLVN